MASSYTFSIPLIFSAVALHHKAFTSPNPPTTTGRSYNGIVEKTLFRSITFVTVGQKAMVWLIGVAETATILAKVAPSWKYSSTILKSLEPNGSLSQIGVMNFSFLIGTSLIIAGGALRWACYRTLGKMFTYEVSVQKEHKLITSGPYGVVRHPSYSGVLLIITGLIIWQSAPCSWMRQSNICSTWGGKIFVGACATWLGTLGLGGVLRARAEDDILSKEFGDQWKSWAARVPYLLVPFVY
ncbi:hypothetical protein BT96DRAFT_917890 [Gymnopus androsaceus JB14]|uniref:Protein-S-isoprenylcysteine O-methyltransferase n=1 Tax=Gymnopus androsaceus JB14 TaxID=1447944 RepID=A0A6A4HUQ2_9AGAR|nr:hypothetical protein BT96DRAFT_917890 [Gymnopus androsaceus JB14]